MKKALKLIMLILVFPIILTIGISATERIVAEGKCGDNITWKLKNVSQSVTSEYHLYFEGTGTIKGYNKDGGGTNYATKDNSQFADHREYITKAFIGEGITKLGDFSLAFFPALQAVELSSTVDSFGIAAFENCSSLRAIYRRGSEAVNGADLTGIKKLDAYVFDGCSALTSVTFDPEFSDSIPTMCFKNAVGITMVSFPETLKSIKDSAFEGCSGIRAIQVKGNPKISARAFYMCVGVEVVYGKLGTSAEQLCIRLGARFSEKEPEALDPVDPTIIASGDCGEKVFWLLRNIGEGDEKYYVLEVSGEGDTMENYSSSGEAIQWANQDKMQWAEHREFIKKVVIGDNITRLGNCALAYLPALEYVELSPNVTHFNDKVFEGDSELISIYIRGNEPVEGDADFSNIVDHGPYELDACVKLKNIIFSDHMIPQVLETEFFKGCTFTDIVIPASVTRITSDAFENCVLLSSITFLGDPYIDEGAFRWARANCNLYGKPGGNVERYAKENSMFFLPAVDVLVYLDGKLLSRDKAVYGSTYENILFNGELYMLYTDMALTKPYDMSASVNKKLILHASPLLSSRGFDVKGKDIQGLESLYSFDLLESKGNSKYAVKELGAIASPRRSVSMRDMKIGLSTVYKLPIISEGTLNGKLYEKPLGRNALFALTAVGYEGDSFEERATSAIYSRGYVILSDKENGKEYTFYTDVFSSDLVSASADAIKNGADPAKAEFIKAASEITIPESTIYTKRQLMSVLEDIFKEGDKYIVGQYTTFEDENTLTTFTDSFFEMTGQNIGLVSFDMDTILSSGCTSEAQLTVLADDIAEYARMGGIFSLSYHLENPRDGTTHGRGELGEDDTTWQELVTEGTALNTSLRSILEPCAAFLQMLEDRGVPVLWRPLHEMNGGWFWWCVRQGENDKAIPAENYVNLWKFYYDYFVYEKGLGNLIWIYSPNFKTSATESVMYAYPGGEYVDIVGLDWYSGMLTVNDIQGSDDSYSALMATGKVTAITEFGTRGSLSSMWKKKQQEIYNSMSERDTMKMLIDAGLPLTYVLNWDGGYEFSRLGRADEYMEVPETLGCSELLALFRAKNTK